MVSESSLAQRLDRLEALEAIRELKHRYLACCDAKDPQGMRACFADGPVPIDYGAVGTFENADALQEIYTQIACHPHMVEIHHGANPRIELSGPDAASGEWSMQYQLINTQEQTLTQLAGRYEDEYHRFDGVWKISATRFVATSSLSLELGPAAVAVRFAGRP